LIEKILDEELEKADAADQDESWWFTIQLERCACFTSVFLRNFSVGESV
jgi:hypothetical protein